MIGMQITIIGVGKIKEGFMIKAIGEYQKRLGRYCRLHILEVPDEKAPVNLSHKEMEQVKGLEGERILGLVREGMYVIALDIQGKFLSSEELAGRVEQLGVQGNSNLVFIIGGSLGLSGQVLKRADFCLSFSPMTFPHQLMRLLLLEQLYRSFKIIKGEAYHK